MVQVSVSVCLCAVGSVSGIGDIKILLCVTEQQQPTPARGNQRLGLVPALRLGSCSTDKN